MARILLIDDQDRTWRLCQRALPEHELLGPARSWREAREALRAAGRGLDLVLLDVHFDVAPGELLGLPEGDQVSEAALERARRQQGLFILEALRRGHPDLPVILMTSREDLPLERAAERLSVEEYTYFLDDEFVDANALRAQIDGIVRARAGQVADGPVFWGRSMELRRLRAQLQTLARGRLPVILAGPTGTGKSLIARHFVHPCSGRAGRFVAVDLSTLPRDLMSAHLFGSVRGAYTGSVADRKGAFEEADGGTLFLDEVGNLPEEAQKMLLTVLQEGSVTRIGDVRERRVDVKLVAATCEDLPELVRGGRFRADLYMRLNPACMVRLPPLAERMSDLVGLIEFCVDAALAGPYLRELVSAYQARFHPGESRLRLAVGGVPEAEPGVIFLLLARKAMAMLRRHPWPGNLRELAMTIENALIFTFAELVQLSEGAGPGGRADVVQLRPKLLADLLRTTRPEPEADGVEGFAVRIGVRPADTLNGVSSDVERQYFTALYVAHEGDFEAMGQALLGEPDCGRKVQLRFNQLGLKVRDLKSRLP